MSQELSKSGYGGYDDDEEHEPASTNSPSATTYSHSHHGHTHTQRLDLSNKARGIWLVKVPKYLSTRWERIPDDVDAANIRIYKTSNGQPSVMLTLSEATLCLKEDGEVDIPKEHELITSPFTQTHQSIGVFSTEQNEVMGTEKVYLDGKIQQKLECRPIADANYMKLKQDETKKMAQPVRQTIHLDRPVQTYKPVANHTNNIEYEEKKKSEGKKSRDDRDKVMEMLFGAFEKHQFYNLKDLVRITNQPVGYLKEVLKEVCNYCVKNPHKNMWELKPENRHYKEDLED